VRAPVLFLAALVLGAAGCSSGEDALVAGATAAQEPAQVAAAAPAAPGAPGAPGAPTVGTPQPGTDHAAFTSPSGNITCLLEKDDGASDAVRCAVAERQWDPPAPEGCGTGPGDGLTISEGRAHGTCAGDDITGWVEPGTDGPVELAYGSVLHLGAVGCESSEAGVRCTDTSTGAGFLVSRGRYEVFGG
jgi:pyruvate/2-oxoglutarate dehydrogenase complex dihydrolipoamide acyltransferase (E2) component